MSAKVLAPNLSVHAEILVMVFKYTLLLIYFFTNTHPYFLTSLLIYFFTSLLKVKRAHLCHCIFLVDLKVLLLKILLFLVFCL